jgi:sterol desaturase/sphingolipid hydroxylase (fatty acid hydroxylase superfamily)
VDVLGIAEPTLRLGCFAAVLAAMATWEIFAPRRARDFPRLRRWPSNLAVVALGALLLRLLFPVAAVGVAALVEARGFGLLQWIAGPAWLEAALAIVALDGVIYAQHVAFHRVPALWRLHRMHHTDLDLDVTTALRFHPIEIALSMLLKCAAVAVLGAAPLAVVLFEIVLNGIAMFNHANVRLASRVDRILRRVLVTPDMHRVHHSVLPAETNSNYGFNLPWWDRWFGTYRAQPSAGHDAMTIGVEPFRDARQLRLDRMLLQPLERA